jgi:hypothetical protein
MCTLEVNVTRVLVTSFHPPPEKEHCYACGREVNPGQMSRHLAHFPQCSVDMERSAKRCDDDGRRRKKRRKKLFPAPTDQLSTEFENADCVLDTDDHAIELRHRRSSRLAIFMSAANSQSTIANDSSLTINSLQDGEISAVCTTENECEDFPAMDDDIGSPSAGEDEDHPENVPDSSIGVDGSLEAEEVEEAEDGPNSSMLAAYQEHIHSLDDNGLNLSLFSCEEKVQIDLLQTLSKIGAPMKAYEAIMQWTNRSVRSGYVFRNTPITSRKTVLSRVSKRLNRDALTPTWETLHLPYSDVTIKVAYFSASAVFADLLSCSHLNKDVNYIFHGDWNPDNDPYAVPNGIVIGDLNTGRSYLKTHRSLCKNENDMLLACPFAIDRTYCDVGGCSRLPLEPITMQYGLVQFNIRKKPEAMRVLGYIHPLKVDIQSVEPGVAPSESATNAPLPMYKKCTNATWKVNEYHMQIDFILRRSGFLDLQERGIKWNIRYMGKLYPTVLHPFVPFIIGDTEGHDALCGHYKSRTSGVAQLCRVCECPTMKSGWSKARQFAKRKSSKVNQLVRAKNFTLLQQKSQHMLVNAFDSIRFGAHSDCGIFGACPGEILHLVLLGWFKYVVKSFFKQIGQNGVAATKYVRLCHDIASQLGRQSDRDIPRTTTNDFSSASNIPGHEYAGILVIMLLSFETSRYGEIFERARALAIQGGHVDKHPGHDNFIADWKLLLSSLLEWWAWMKQPQIERRCVKRSIYATSYLLRLLKTVAPRHEGMKNNTVKTHLVLHMAEDIQNFGVPEIYNSSYAESAHIPIAKKTVKNTQKRNKTYEIQAAQRYAENLVISHANREINSKGAKNGLLLDDGARGRRQQWIGKSYSISANAFGIPRCSWQSANRKKVDEATPQLTMDKHVLQSIADYLLPCLDPPIAHCQTEYTCPKGVLYRAHPSYEDKPWYDHVLVDWDDIATPAKICSIINLHNAKPGSVIKFPGQGAIPAEAGLYVLVHSYDAIDTVADKAAKEAAKQVSMHVMPKRRRWRRDQDAEANLRASQVTEATEHPSEEEDPPIFKPYRLSLHADEGGAMLPILYIIHVDSIVGPTIVINDISREYANHDPCVIAYPFRPYIFMFRRRHQWAANWTSFIDWQYNKTVHEGVEESSEDED